MLLLIKSVVDELVLTVPAVKLTDLLTDLLGGVLSVKLTHSLEVNLSACGRHIEEEFLCKGTVLDIGKDLLHGLLGLFCYELGTSYIVAVLSSVGDEYLMPAKPD